MQSNIITKGNNMKSITIIVDGKSFEAQVDEATLDNFM